MLDRVVHVCVSGPSGPAVVTVTTSAKNTGRRMVVRDMAVWGDIPTPSFYIV